MPVDVDELFQRTQKLFQEDRYEEGAALIESALNEEPENPRLLQLSAEFSNAIGDYDRADHAWAKLTALAPDDSYYWCRRAEFSLEMGDLEDAIHHILKSLSFEETARAYLALGQAFMRMGEYDKAISACDDAVRVNPKADAAYLYKANCLTHQQKYQAALDMTDLYKERSERPDAAVILIRVDCYEGLGRLEDAMREVDTAIKINYILDAAYTRRGMINYQLGNLEATIDDCSQAIELGCSLAHEVACLQTRAMAFADMKQYGLALTDLNQAIELDDDPNLQVLRNRVLAQASQ